MPEETPIKFYYSKRHPVHTDFPVYNRDNAQICTCQSEEDAQSMVAVLNGGAARIDGERVIYIKVSDFEAMRQEIKVGKRALGSAERAADYARRERDALRGQFDLCIKMRENLEAEAQNRRAQLTERALIIKDLEAQARVMIVQIEEDKMAISALQEDAAKDAQELRSRRSRQEPTATERQRNADDMGWPPRSPAFVPPPPTSNADADRLDFPLEMTNEPVLGNTPVMQKTGELRNVYGAVIATYLPDKEVWKCRNGHHWPTPEAAAACDIGDCDTPF